MSKFIAASRQATDLDEDSTGEEDKRGEGW